MQGEHGFLFRLFFGCAGSSLLRGLFLVVVRGGCSSLRWVGFSLQWPLLFRSTGSKACGPQQLRGMGLAALRRVGSSWTGIDPMSPALAGGLSTTGPPGEPSSVAFSLRKNPRLTFTALKMHFKASLLLASHLI